MLRASPQSHHDAIIDAMENPTQMENVVENNPLNPSVSLETDVELPILPAKESVVDELSMYPAAVDDTASAEKMEINELSDTVVGENESYVKEDTRESISLTAVEEARPNEIVNLTSDVVEAENQVYDEVSKDKVEEPTLETVEQNEPTSFANATVQEDVQVKAFNEQLLKYWYAVNENPQDFTSWTYLLQFVEQENKIVPARKAFEAFLKRYPFCYGYWKKFADMERKSDEIDRAREVFEKGVQEIALSVDLWVHYLNFTSQMSKEQPNCAETMRNLFERALSAAGEEFRSDKLWEAYIEWEKSQKQLQKVTALYDRVLAVPTLNYSKHWTKFQEHINSNPLEEVVIPEELLKLKAELGAAPPGFTVDNEAPVAPPLGGEVDVNGMAVTSEVPESEGSESVDPETRAVRKKIIAQRQTLHSANEGEVSKRWTFEEGIKRPYFHVKPLEKMQLKNWRDYLDFEVSTGNHRRVVILFERCVIACAMYEEFWQKFASYMEMHDCLEGVQHVYERACQVHLPKKPRIHLAWAALEEKHGNVLKARDILANLDNAVPGLVHVKLCRVNFERRCNDFQNACAIYEQAIAECSDTQLISFYSVKYSRFLTKITKNYEKAKEVLKGALDKDKDSRRLYLQLLDVEMSMPKMNEDEIDKIFELVKSSSLTDDVKESFSQRRLEFLEDHSNSIVKIMKAQEAHEKLYKNTSQSLTGRKRASDNGSETDAKVAKTDDSSNSIQYNHTDYGTTDYSSATGYSTATTAYNYSTAQWPGYGTSQPQGYNYGNWYQQYGNTYA